MDRLNVHHVGNVFLFTPRLDEAYAWYTALFGKPGERAMPQLAVWELGSVRFTLHAEDELNHAGADLGGTVPYFDVENADEAADFCVNRGGRVHRGPKTVFSGERLVQVEDPFGGLIGLRQPPGA